MTAVQQPGGTIHFWAPEPLSPEALSWDPDADPTQFADGFGHNMLELFVRMRRDGHPVAIGPTPLPGSRVVVFLPSLLERRAQLRLLRRVLPRRRLEVVAIRSDFLIDYRLPFEPSLEVKPNQASVVGDRQIWIPPLPQRGLRCRSQRRGDAVTTMTYKGYPAYLPREMQTDAWRDELAAMGIAWQPDVLDLNSGANTWHDFSGTDVAMCLRDEGCHGLLRKPATKLINAWCAGVIPLVGREPAYVELGTDREDCIFVESPRDVVLAVADLQRDHALVERLRTGAARQAQKYSPDGVLSRWVDVLTGPLPVARVVTGSSLRRSARVGARWLWDAAHGDAASPVWRPDPS